MALSCPVCKSKFTIAQAMHEKAMSEMIELAANFGKNWGLVFEYTECFRQEQWGSVREQKRLRLLKEIWKLFEKNEFEIQSKRYRTDWTKIIAAIRTVVDTDKFGVKNHNYLKRVLLGLDAERVSAEGMTAREETERESSRASGGERPKVKGERDGEEISGAQYMKDHDIGSLVEEIGSKA
jgi:hypothetical protein